MTPKHFGKCSLAVVCQEDLRLVMSVSALQRIEYGERKVENLSLKTALALADALGVDVEELD